MLMFQCLNSNHLSEWLSRVCHPSQMVVKLMWFESESRLVDEEKQGTGTSEVKYTKSH